ncbi:hypothetical protein ACSBR2_015191 [Camellia fascicularis]
MLPFSLNCKPHAERERCMTHKDFMETRVNAFVCDLTADDLSPHISPSSVDIVTMLTFKKIFMLSLVSPKKMPLVLQNIRKVLKPNGSLLFHDSAIGVFAQERPSCKDQKISENFYVRGNGTNMVSALNKWRTGQGR